ncbi:ABC transporter ATP-binding protein [Maricaulis sp.]|uniref:ABC transporter ATP-binding protein n=1 Tax=Maricaulis sp. TaxID=1486257 RepID=UPI002B2664DC|nr:ATP-binding cassette domain-containing protein [Maricaulis sp.]
MVVDVRVDGASVYFPQRRQKVRRRMLSGNRVGGDLIEYRDRPHVAALQGIDLDLQAGCRVGLVGHNGGGKTTLLRTIAGVYTPTEGEATVRGRVSTLFSNAVALSEYDTGRANLELAGLLNGLSARAVRRTLPEAVELAGLAAYVDDPIVSYSEGMKTRLGFAMAVLTKPDILLIDEILNASDWAFLDQIRNNITALNSPDHILVIASHSRELLRHLCDEAIELERGRIKRRGSVESVFAAMDEDRAAAAQWPDDPGQ